MLQSPARATGMASQTAGVDLVTIETVEQWHKICNPEIANPDMLHVVEVYADWCGPSLAGNSTFARLKTELIAEGKKLKLWKVPTSLDATDPILSKTPTNARPTYHLYVAGDLVQTVEGCSTPQLEKCADAARCAWHARIFH